MSREPDPMTGYEHIETQRTRILRVVNWLLLVLIPAWIWMLIVDSQLVAQLVIIASLTLVLGTVLVLRPRCPFCDRTLALSWKGLRINKYCSQCGESFASKVQLDRSPTQATEP